MNPRLLLNHQEIRRVFRKASSVGNPSCGPILLITLLRRFVIRRWINLKRVSPGTELGHVPDESHCTR